MYRKTFEPILHEKALSTGSHCHIPSNRTASQNGLITPSWNQPELCCHIPICPTNFWAEAVLTAVCLRNRTTTCANQQQLTPFDKWYGHKPNISHLRVFGCAAYCHVPSAERRRLDKKAHRMCFIGYSKNPKGYRLIDLSSNKVVTRRDVAFNETDFHFVDRNDESVSISPDLVNETEDEIVESESQPAEPPRRSLRAAQCPDYYGYSESADTVTTECADAAKLTEHCAYTVQEIYEPATIEEVLNGPHAKEWKVATGIW